MGISTHSLRWCDFDAPLRGFDPEPARRIAAELLKNRPRPLNDKARQALEDAIDRRLVAEYGGWVRGWTWAASEPGGGGPVTTWCCAAHSLLGKGDAEPATSVERVVGAVTEWREFIVELGTRFAAIAQSTADLPPDAATEFAAARLLPVVLDRTDADDAWYGTFTRIVAWFLEYSGQEPDRVTALVRAAVQGRFRSWCAPDEATAREVCASIGRSVASGASAPPVPPADALVEWIYQRKSAWKDFEARQVIEPAVADAHRAFIETVERARDPHRALRMSAALDACRASASRGEPLALARLREWQGLVLGVPTVPYRTTDAFAKGGRERYGTLGGDLVDFLGEYLTEANAPGECVAVRAARAYLDVCFFHPFPDGNARAARLALDHVLTRAGLSLFSVEPIFQLSRAANDPWATQSLAYAVDHLICKAPAE